MRVRVYPYKKGSRSARYLARGLGVKRLKNEGSRFRPRLTDIIINWGSSCLPFDPTNVGQVINHPACVAQATNKLRCLIALEKAGVPTVPFTQSPYEAMGWGSRVVLRHRLTGHSGAGIELWDPDEDDDIPRAPLFTKYVKKTSEWRVHVADGLGFFVQRKVKDPNREVKDWAIRNHGAGFIYQMHNNDVPDAVIEAGLDAVNELGLDFGAADVIWNGHHERAYVLEVNTSPGLEGDTTRQKYIEEVGKLVKSYQFP